MKRYKVTGYIDVAVTTIVEVEDGEELTEDTVVPLSRPRAKNLS